jgi:hypothetical protein
VNTGEISCRADRIAQLDDAVPDEQAGHHQSCEEQQKGIAAYSAPPFRIRAICLRHATPIDKPGSGSWGLGDPAAAGLALLRRAHAEASRDPSLPDYISQRGQSSILGH